MAKYKFKLLHGEHTDSVKEGDRTAEKVYHKGDTIETDTDLIALLDPTGREDRFELVEGPDDHPAKAKAPALSRAGQQDKGRMAQAAQQVKDDKAQAKQDKADAKAEAKESQKK